MYQHIYKILVLLYTIISAFNTCIAQDHRGQEYFQGGDRAFYFFDIGSSIQQNQLNNLRQVFLSHKLPRIRKSLDGIHIGTSRYYGERFIIGSTFLYHYETDSTNYISLKQRNFELNLYAAYNIIRAKFHERFGIVPQLGIFMNRTTRLLEKHSDKDLPLVLGGPDFTLKKGKNKIIRGEYGAFSSIRINYSTRTQSLIDIFLFGIEPGIKYALTPTGRARVKKRKFFYKADEKRFATFMNIHFKVPLAAIYN